MIDLLINSLNNSPTLNDLVTVVHSLLEGKISIE